MTQSPSSIQTQAERWGAEAKRLADGGDFEGAFNLYRKAAEALPGAPWLQHRTADLARKLGKHDLAIHYFRRSADGFIRAGFQRRGIAPLRLAWTLARAALPEQANALREIADSLIELQRGLDLQSDAEVTADQTAEALRRMPHKTEGVARMNTVRSPAVAVEDLRVTLAPAADS